MDLKLTPVSMPTTIRPNAGVRAPGAAGAEGVGGGFSGALKSALKGLQPGQHLPGVKHWSVAKTFVR